MNLQKRMKKLSPKEFREILHDKSKVLFIFDYDGTLTPIVKQRNEAILKARQVDILNKINNSGRSSVAIVSGREYFNLQELIDKTTNKLDEDIILIGSHGAEIGIDETVFNFSNELKEIENKISAKFGLGIDFERKKISLAIHCRDYPNRSRLIEGLYEIANEYSGIFRVQEGYNVFEFVPKETNKSLAINYLSTKYTNYFLLYFGDDLTDCFAFDRINELNGMSVQVSNHVSSSAKYGIASVDELYALLENFIAT